jgi:hypothetical protein
MGGEELGTLAVKLGPERMGQMVEKLGAEEAAKLFQVGVGLGVLQVRLEARQGAHCFYMF